MTQLFGIAILEQFARGDVELTTVQAALAAALRTHLGATAPWSEVVDEAHQRRLITAEAREVLHRQINAGPQSIDGVRAPNAVAAVGTRMRPAQFRESRGSDETLLRGRQTAEANAGSTGAGGIIRSESMPPKRRTDMDLGHPHDWTGVWEAPVKAGDVLKDRYRLERLLGRGGMGDVFLAYDEQEQQYYAIKVLNQDFREHPDSVAALREETLKCKQLAHPNIVGVYVLDRAGTHPYMVMEFLDGKSLENLIAEDFARGMPLPQALPIINGIGAALAYAHDRNVIHSDLKPSNVFVLPGGKAKVLDFGIARAMRPRSDGRFDARELEALTPEYASPEMIAGHEPPDPRDDVYGFACLAYELITGRHPFGDDFVRQIGGNESDRDVALRRARGKPEPSSRLSRRQQRAFAHALAYERTARTASVEAFLEELGGTASRGGFQVPPKLAMYAGAGLLLVAVAAGLAVLLARPDEGDAYVDYLRRNPPARMPEPRADWMETQIRDAERDIDLASDPSNDPLGLLCGDVLDKLTQARGVDPNNESALKLMRTVYERVLEQAERARANGDQATAEMWLKCARAMYPESRKLRSMQGEAGDGLAVSR